MHDNAIYIEPLDLGGNGPKVAVKDVIDIAGTRTTAGSRALARQEPASEHAEIVAEILRNDCRIVGKANTHEFAFGLTGINGWTGTPVNQRFPQRIPGGSSSGSAVAVQTNTCDFAIGTDTGGSIRLPAACCGVYGLKPTFGRLSRKGVLPVRSSLDCVGPLADSAWQLARAMRVMEPRFGEFHGEPLTRIGWIETQADQRLARGAKAGVALLGGAAKSISLAHFARAHDAGLAVIGAETYRAYGDLIATGLVGDDVVARLKAAAKIGPDALAEAERVREEFSAEIDFAFEEFDVLAMPTLPEFPPLLAQAQDLARMVRLSAHVRPFNLSGHPALAIPLPPIDNQPASLQLIARKGDDERLVAAAGEFAARLGAPA